MGQSHDRVVRLVIQEATLTANDATEQPRQAALTLLWSGGVTTTHTVTCPPRGWHGTTDEDVLAQIRVLAQQLPDHQIAQTLHAAGSCTLT